MLSPLAMTLLTGDAELVAAGVPHHAPLPLQGERGAVTFQTARDDQASEVDLTIRIPRTVDPSPESGQIGNRQFEQEPAAPVEIRLPSSSRPDDQLDAPRDRSTLGRIDPGLIESPVTLFHSE